MKCAVKLNEERKIRSEAINNTVEYMIIAFVQFLGDKRGWKQKSICDALKYCIKHAEAIADGYTTLQEAREDIWENYGIRVNDDGRIEVRDLAGDTE